MPYRDKKNRLCGFLNIEEEKNHKNFSRRYFVLDYEDGKLKIFYDSPLNLPKTSRTPCREINLNHISKVSDARAERPKARCCFVIDYAGSQCFLQADNEEDMHEWIEKLDDSCRVTVPEAERPKKTEGTTEWRSIGDQEKREGFRTEVRGGVVLKFYGSESEEECRSGEHGWPANQIPSILSGYAVKQGAMRKNWKRRYFVLSTNGLSYYKSDQDKVPIKCIEMDEITEARLVGGIHHPHRENLYEVVTPKRIYNVQCDSPEESRQWIEAINKQCQVLKEIGDKKEPTEFEEPHVPPDSEIVSQPDVCEALSKSENRETSSYDEKMPLHEEIKPSKAVWESAPSDTEAGDRRSKASIRQSKKSWLLW